MCICFFKQKTAYEMRTSDWSSDVCSSDLVAGQGEFAADAGGAPANRRNGHNRGTREARQHVRQRLQPGRTGRQGSRLLERSEEVVVGQEEALDGAVEDHHLDLRVLLQGLNDGFQLGDRPGAEYVQGWVVEGDAPVSRRVLLETDPG